MQQPPPTFIPVPALPAPRARAARPGGASSLRARRSEWGDVFNGASADTLSTGGLCVPRHLWRRDLRARGVYRSVEYEIERLELDGARLRDTASVSAARRGDVVAYLRPAAGALRPRFERAWPVAVRLADARLWSYKRDVGVCAAVCAALAAAIVAAPGYVGGALGGIYGIPSESMAPTLRRGDAVLVEKVSTSHSGGGGGGGGAGGEMRRRAAAGEIVFFRPPQMVRDAVRDAGGALRPRDLLVKRVVATAGDRVVVDEDGVRVNGAVVAAAVEVPGPLQVRMMARTVPDGFVFVLGDNAGASVDSRFWGLLPEADIVGRPVARVFPLDRITSKV